MMPRHEPHNQRHELAGPISPGRKRIWRTIRMMGVEGFKIRDVIALAEVRRKAVEKFLRPLVLAGYLRAERGGPARIYFMLRDTGPIPPRVNAAGLVLDLNTEVARDRARHAELIKELRR